MYRRRAFQRRLLGSSRRPVDLDIARRTLLDGAMDFVSKPFNFARLQMIVDAALAFGRRETA